MQRGRIAKSHRNLCSLAILAWLSFMPYSSFALTASGADSIDPPVWKIVTGVGTGTFHALNTDTGHAFSISPTSLHTAQVGAPFGVRLLDANAAPTVRERTRTRLYFQGVYRGIDLVYYAKHDRFEYDFVVTPGSDPARIRLQMEGADGAELNAAGDLVLRRGAAQMVHHAPVAYQDIANKRLPVAAMYKLTASNEVSIEVGAYDRRHVLIIDPVVSYTTAPAAADTQFGRDIAVDSQGNSYVVRRDSSGAVAVLTALIVDKFDSAGNNIPPSLLLASGTGAVQSANAIAVDASDNVYIVGVLPSGIDLNPAISTAGSYQPARSGTLNDAFLVKLDPNLNVVYATYLGGPDSESAYGVTVDPNGAAYVVGAVTACAITTCVQGFTAARTGFQAVPTPGSPGAFMVRVAPNGASLDYFTYIGGVGADNAYAVAVSPAGLAYVAGNTSSTDAGFTTPGAYDAVCGAGGLNCDNATDAFLAIVDTNLAGAASRSYVTYLGGDGADTAFGVALDANSVAYLAGNTNSQAAPFPTTATAYRTTYAGGNGDAFISALTPAAGLIYSTYFGSYENDTARGIRVDNDGTLYIAGTTLGASTAPPAPAPTSVFPLVNATQPAFGGASDAYVAKLDTKIGGAAGLLFSTYFGGAGADDVGGMAIDPDGSMYVTGGLANATTDLFVHKIVVRADVAVTQTVAPSRPRPGDSVTYTVTVSNFGADIASGLVLTDAAPVGLTVTSVTPSQGTCSAGAAISCSLGTLAPNSFMTVSVIGVVNSTANLTNTATVRAFVTDGVLANNRSTISAASSFCSGARAVDCTVSISSNATGGGGVLDLWSLLALLGLYAGERYRRRRA